MRHGDPTQQRLRLSGTKAQRLQETLQYTAALPTKPACASCTLLTALRAARPACSGFAAEPNWLRSPEAWVAASPRATWVSALLRGNKRQAAPAAAMVPSVAVLWNPAE